MCDKSLSGLTQVGGWGFRGGGFWLPEWPILGQLGIVIPRVTDIGLIGKGKNCIKKKKEDILYEIG